MAGFANRKKKPQQGIYPGSGVAQGGQQGRKKTLHGGLTSAKKGGANPLGSQRRPINTQKRNVRPQVGWKPSAPIISPGYAAGGSIAPNIGAAIKPSAPAYNAPAYTPAKLGDQSTRDSIYAYDAANAKYKWDIAGAEIPELKAQEIAAPGLYRKNLYDIDWRNKQTREGEDASLAARGIFQSGGKPMYDAERTMGYNKAKDALNYEYGDEAVQRIQRQIAAIDAARGALNKETGAISGGQWAIDINNADLAALGRFNENNPAPLAEIPAPAGGGGSAGGAAAGGAAAGVDGKKYKSGYYYDGGTLMFLNENGARAKVTNPWKIKVAKAGNLDGMVDAPWKQHPAAAAPAAPARTPGFTPGVAPGIGGAVVPATLPKPATVPRGAPAPAPAPKRYKSGFYVDNGKLMFLNEDGGRAPVTSPWKLKVWRAGNLGGMVNAPWNQ